MIIIRDGIVHNDIDEMDVISMISLIRFNDGGAAILADANRNHHKDIMGVDDNKPFIKNILRVCVSS